MLLQEYGLVVSSLPLNVLAGFQQSYPRSTTSLHRCPLPLAPLPRVRQKYASLPRPQDRAEEEFLSARYTAYPSEQRPSEQAIPGWRIDLARNNFEVQD